MRQKLKNRLTVILILLSFLVISAISITVIFALTQQNITTEVGVEYTPDVDISLFTFAEKSSDGTYSIRGSDSSDWESSSGTLIIPKTYNGKPITSIGALAFARKPVKNVIIQDGVTTIEESAFDSCVSLTSITIPNSVTSIGSSAFSGCTGLTSITIPNSVTSIGKLAFSGCTNLTNVTFKDPNGWYAQGSINSSDPTIVNLTGLDNASTAAELLTSTYYDWYWFKGTN